MIEVVQMFYTKMIFECKLNLYFRIILTLQIKKNILCVLYVYITNILKLIV